MKTRIAWLLLVLFTLGLSTSLPAKEKKVGIFLNLTTGTFNAFALGAGVKVNIFKSISIKPGIDITGSGGRILHLDAIVAPNSSGRLRPFFSIGIFDYSFKGDWDHDSDAIRSLAFGLGLDFYSKKDTHTASVGIKLIREDDQTYPLFFVNFIFFNL
ncbi:MAG: hypothetical protein GY765_26705 [bacterium]|nr:hypothetical protein [bacterium]